MNACGPCGVCGHCWPLTDDSYKCPRCASVGEQLNEEIRDWIQGVVTVAIEKHEDGFLHHNEESES